MGLTEGLVLSCEDTERTFLRVGIDGEEKRWKEEKGSEVTKGERGRRNKGGEGEGKEDDWEERERNVE
jgi:hypothetical protein